jgi:hypothetical protein
LVDQAARLPFSANFAKNRHETYWRQQVDDAHGRPRELWSIFSTLLGRGCTPVNDAVDAAVCHNFFDINAAAEA